MSNPTPGCCGNRPVNQAWYCSRPVTYTALSVGALALILGILALAGTLYPQSALAPLGQTFGTLGYGIAIGVGGGLVLGGCMHGYASSRGCASGQQKKGRTSVQHKHKSHSSDEEDYRPTRRATWTEYAGTPSKTSGDRHYKDTTSESDEDSDHSLTSRKSTSRGHGHHSTPNRWVDDGTYAGPQSSNGNKFGLPPYDTHTTTTPGGYPPPYSTTYNADSRAPSDFNSGLPYTYTTTAGHPPPSDYRPLNADTGRQGMGTGGSTVQRGAGGHPNAGVVRRDEDFDF